MCRCHEATHRQRRRNRLSRRGQRSCRRHRSLLERFAQGMAASDRDPQIRLARACPRFHRLRQEGRPEWAGVETLGHAVLGAVADGDDRAAAKAFMTYWLGRWRWWLSPERFKSAIAATIPKVALEFAIAIDAPTTLQDYAGITAPHLP